MEQVTCCLWLAIVTGTRMEGLRACGVLVVRLRMKWSVAHRLDNILRFDQGAPETAAAASLDVQVMVFFAVGSFLL